MSADPADPADPAASVTGRPRRWLRRRERVEETDIPDPGVGAGKEPAAVQRMFDRVAPRYDLANTVFSLGQDALWRRVASRAADPRPGQVLLDVAAGTGALARDLADLADRRGEAAATPDEPATVIALDFSLPMLVVGAERERRAGQQRLLWCAGDGMRLPLPDASVDAVTIAFGLRNLPDPAAGLAELARVTRPGGRLVVLEFSRPTWGPFRRVYHAYLGRVMPLVARVLTSDPSAYVYLARSIRLWPSQEEMAAILADNGWEQPQWKNLTGGIVACHRAVRPVR